MHLCQRSDGAGSLVACEEDVEPRTVGLFLLGQFVGDRCGAASK